MKKFLLRLVIFSLAFTVTIAAILAISAYNFNRPTTLNSEANFTVAAGAGASQIAINLQSAGLIRNATFFRIHARFTGNQSLFRAGSYTIPAGLTTAAISQLLVEGVPDILYSVTIPEGRTLRQTANILYNNGFIADPADFITAASNPELLQRWHILADTAQGFLFPSTYRMPKPYPAERIAELMIRTFYQQLATVAPWWDTLTLQELNYRVNMAGLVEKEYRVPGEAALMASVFFNRLERGIRLESCASVVYVITEILGRPHPTRLFYVDLDIDHPYNVYRNHGLPPSPISSPGLVALNAAFNPATTNYLFFVVNEAATGIPGSHQFSETYAQHLQGREAYILATFSPQY
ncbi:MAG: endolytic transglycosylase MltG [Spirochaetaceae bacterium]|nr:endolytic transglycosylase MltG [Spirochaetaceae bacterium]